MRIPERVKRMPVNGSCVAKTRDTSLVFRDHEIREMRTEGYNLQQIADTVGLTKSRVSQICRTQGEEVADDEYRAFLIDQTEFALAKVQNVLRQPPPPRVTPSGKIVYEPLLDKEGEPVMGQEGHSRGNPLGDVTKPVLDWSAHVEAAKAVPSLADRLAKLRGVDKKPVLPKDEIPGFNDAETWWKAAQAAQERLTETEKSNRELEARLARYERGEIVPAEIVPET